MTKEILKQKKSKRLSKKLLSKSLKKIKSLYVRKFDESLNIQNLIFSRNKYFVTVYGGCSDTKDQRKHQKKQLKFGLLRYQFSILMVLPIKNCYKTNSHILWFTAHIFPRYILMRRTIYPDSKFLCFWEMSRGIFAFLTGMLYPSLFIHQLYYPQITYIVFALDATAFVDMWDTKLKKKKITPQRSLNKIFFRYVRFHVCYYDKNGILVTHPKCTAVYYLSHSFIIDLIGCLPFDNMLKLVYDVRTKSTFALRRFYMGQASSRFFKLLQLYRLPTAFSYFSMDIFKSMGLFALVFCFPPRVA